MNYFRTLLILLLTAIARPAFALDEFEDCLKYQLLRQPQNVGTPVGVGELVRLAARQPDGETITGVCIGRMQRGSESFVIVVDGSKVSHFIPESQIEASGPETRYHEIPSTRKQTGFNCTSNTVAVCLHYLELSGNPSRRARGAVPFHEGLFEILDDDLSGEGRLVKDLLGEPKEDLTIEIKKSFASHGWRTRETQSWDDVLKGLKKNEVAYLGVTVGAHTDSLVPVISNIDGLQNVGTRRQLVPPTGKPFSTDKPDPAFVEKLKSSSPSERKELVRQWMRGQVEQGKPDFAYHALFLLGRVQGGPFKDQFIIYDCRDGTIDFYTEKEVKTAFKRALILGH